jgi:hypothetical protein
MYTTCNGKEEAAGTVLEKRQEAKVQRRATP